MNGPCTWPVRSLYTAVDGRIHRPQTRACTRYTAAYTGRKHGRVQGTRPCTRPCSGHSRTMHGRVHGTYTALHTGRKDGRIDGLTARARPCMYTVRTRSGTGLVPGRVCRVPAAYTAVFGTRTDNVHGPCTAENVIFVLYMNYRNISTNVISFYRERFRRYGVFTAFFRDIVYLAELWYDTRRRNTNSVTDQVSAAVAVTRLLVCRGVWPYPRVGGFVLPMVCFARRLAKLASFGISHCTHGSSALIAAAVGYNWASFGH